MRLTDATVIRPLISGRHVAVYEPVANGVAPATVLTIDAPEVFTCGWLVEGGGGYDCDGFPLVGDCGAVAVGFDNGWACEAGHSHYTYGGESHAEYFDEDEIEAARVSGAPLPPNARSMEGGRL